MNPPPRRTGRLDAPAVQLALFALWLLCTLGLRPLSLPDEGRYAEVAREMLTGGALVPTLNGLPFFHKPPLLYWIDVAAMRVAGITPLAVRIGPMLGAWTMGAALYFAMRRWHGARAATTALIVCASCPLLFLSGQYVNHDMLVGGLIAAAVLAFARAVDAPSADAPVSRRWTLAGWALCALAMLAKGLIGIVLPALVIAPWLGARGRWRQLFALLHPSGPAVFALLAVPWFVAMQSRYPGFADYFFMEQHVRRFALAGFNNAQPFWFFVAALPAATLPWTAWLPAALRRARRAADATGALYVWWVVAVVGFFSLPSSKLLGYALPALAPWCALLALAVADAPAAARAPRWAAALGIAICLGVVGALAWETPKSNRAAALALAERIGGADRVVMVDDYFADLAFYARLPHPAIVASDWDDPALPQHDNWRRELYDAASFDPARGRELLRPLTALDALACGHGGATWFVAQPAQSGRVAAVPGAQRVHADANGELWRVPPRACGEG